MAGQGFDVNFGARTNAQTGDVSPLINTIAPATAASTDANAAKKPADTPPPPAHLSCLEGGLDWLTSKVITNDSWRHTFDHYGSEFLQTASLFTGGKVGLAATILTYGLGNAHADDGLGNAAADFGLGAVKGLAMKGMFNVLGSHIALAPAKGIAMGIGSRAIDTLANRETFTDPANTWQKLKNQTLDGNQWKYDAIVWTLGEGVMGATNAATGNALNRSPIASAMLAGGTFGAVSGGGAEIMRQKAEGYKNIDWKQVAEKGALEGSLNAAAAGAGGALTMAMEHSSVKVTQTRQKSERSSGRISAAEPLSVLRIAASDSIAPLAEDSTQPPPQREFVVTSGKEALDAFQANKAQSATIQVRELTTGSDGQQILGDQKSLFVQQLGKSEKSLLPAAAGADLVASCHPENLSLGEQNNHVFPDGKGHVWLITGNGGQLLLSSGEQAMVKVGRMGDFKNATRLDGGDTTINVMAPLIIGDPKNTNGEFSQGQWAEFDRQLAEAKKLGVNAVSTDVWWGLIEPSKGTFDWSYYDKISQHIINAGLDWVPILSFHQCGGNVGDSYSRPLPDWIWNDLSAQHGRPAEDFKFKSEQGHTSNEIISFFQDQAAQEHYGRVMENFRDHFAGVADHVQEINISLGPAGELRYPSYNSHDQNAGYPTRGSLQMYGNSGVESLRDFMIKRYGSAGDTTDQAVAKIAAKWNIPGLTLDHINPPDNPQQFFDQNNQWNTQYGRDLFDWYNQTLIDHGRNTLGTALSKFGATDSPFNETDIGAKIAGVHWRVGENQNGKIVLSDRLAELSAGLIRTSAGDWNSDEKGHGYQPLLSMLHDLQPLRTVGQGNRIVPFFTCIEIPDGDNGPQVKSLAHTLASWFGMEAQRENQAELKKPLNQQHEDLEPKGENALNGNLHNQTGRDNISSFMPSPVGNGYYHGVTLLRLEDIVNDPAARAWVAQLTTNLKSVKPATTTPGPGGP